MSPRSLPGWNSRRSSIESLDIPLEDSEETLLDRLQSRDDQSPLSLYLRNELRALLAKALGELAEKERQVLSLYYLEELTMKEVGVVMNLGESRVSQIHTAALIHVRAVVKKYSESRVEVSEAPTAGGVQ